MTRQMMIAIASIVVLLLISVGVYIGYYATTADDTSSDEESNTITREEAIKQAREYTPPADAMCTQALTDAVHEETGATYQFPTGCLAPGWVRDDNQISDPQASVESATTDQAVDTKNHSPHHAPVDTPSADPSASSDAAVSRASGEKDGIDRVTRDRAANAIKRIVSDARAHQPSGASENCSRKTTPAVHKATGTRYNFTIDCLPDGWVPTSESAGLSHY